MVSRNWKDNTEGNVNIIKRIIIYLLSPFLILYILLVMIIIIIEDSETVKSILRWILAITCGIIGIIGLPIVWILQEYSVYKIDKVWKRKYASSHN